MDRSGLAVCFLLSLVGIIGCDQPPPPAPQLGKVNGTVNIDGKPVPHGEIHFGMAGVPPKVLEINDGVYSGEASVGKNTVEVFIYVEGPASDKYGGTKSKTNTVPQRYWGAQSTLSADVSSAGPNEFNFDIQSK